MSISLCFELINEKIVHYDVCLYIMGWKEELDVFRSTIKNWAFYQKTIRSEFHGEHERAYFYCDLQCIQWDHELAHNMQNMIKTIDGFNREDAMRLSYCFQRKPWWNNHVVEMHSNCHEAYFDNVVYEKCEKAGQAINYRVEGFEFFISRYFDDEAKGYLQAKDVNWLLNQYHRESFNYLCYLFQDEILELNFGQFCSDRYNDLSKLLNSRKSAMELHQRLKATLLLSATSKLID